MDLTNILFGFALLNNSEEETFFWAFSNFLTIMEFSPTILFSDQETALVNAAKRVFGGTEHKLCAWHIARLLHKNYSYLRGGTPDNNEIYKLMMNLPFEKHTSKFEITAKKIKDHLDSKADYFQGYYNKKTLYVKCYVKDNFCAGTNTTSRIESYHSVLARGVSAKTSLQCLFEVVSEIEENTVFKDEIKESTVSLSIDYLKDLAEIYSTYAVRKFASSFEKFTSYVVEKTFRITFTDEVW